MNFKKLLCVSGFLMILFVILTGAVLVVDVQSIGPDGSSVGLASVNRYFAEHIGVNLIWYHITDWLGIIAICFALGFAFLGLIQFIIRKSVKKVDRQIIALGVFYVLVISIYILFEHMIVNYRPILMNGALEASYPSSHTILVLCIMSTAIIMFDYLLSGQKYLRIFLNVTAVLIMVVTVLGRLISGVHWFTDIIAGMILSAGLVLLFYAVVRRWEK